MKLVNNIQFRVFSNPGEDKEQIKSALLSLAGYSSEQIVLEKIKYKETKAEGFNHKVISIIELMLEKERHCNKFLKRLNEILSTEQKKTLVEQTNRLDDNMNFFVRFDKEAMLDENAEKEKEYVFTDSGNCFHMTMNIEAHPQKKEIGLKIIKQIFDGK